MSWLKRPTTWLALLLFLSPLHAFWSDEITGGLASNTTLLLVLFGIGFQRYQDPAAIAGLAGTLIFVVARFWLWGLARRKRGSWLLLASAITGALVPLVQAWFALLENTPGRMWPTWIGLAAMRVDIVAGGWGWLLAPLSLSLLALGLYRSRLVPRWLPPIGIASALVFAWWRASLTYDAFVQIPEMFSIALYLEVGFLVAVGLSLAIKGVPPRRAEGDTQFRAPELGDASDVAAPAQSPAAS